MEALLVQCCAVAFCVVAIATIDEPGFHTVFSAFELDFPAVMSAWPSSSLRRLEHETKGADLAFSRTVERQNGQAKTALQPANFVRLRD
ncbi:hypothetical protein BC443_15610 [Salinicola sp. MIT1003]|nr:hypothetical protein BC443_15610 [Salinicola sp. MIT1003]